MRLRRFFLHNIGWKLISLAASVLLWFSVVGEPELVTLQAAQVYFAGLSQDFVLLNDPPGVQLEMRGPSAVLNRESLNNVQILLDLSRVQSPGSQTFAISAKEVTLPSGVTLLSAVPSRLVLEFDRRVSKRVSVRADVRGEPANGYRVGPVEATPGSVTISGPESRLAVIEHVATPDIDVTGAAANQEVRVNAFVADPAVQVMSPAVVVRVTIEKGR